MQRLQQWEYLEVRVDLHKRVWKADDGRRGKLKKGALGRVLNQLGLEGWELAGTWPAEDGRAGRLIFKRPRVADSFVVDVAADTGAAAEPAEPADTADTADTRAADADAADADVRGEEGRAGGREPAGGGAVSPDDSDSPTDRSV
jgi:hypothetical protein